MISILASGPCCPMFDSQRSPQRSPQKKFGEQIVDVAEVNQRRCLEESGQWLEKC